MHHGYALPRYLGNKLRLARWVTQHLPDREVYVEPFAGLAHVMLSRRPAQYEVLNDLDDNIWCWWKAVRDHPDELKHRLTYTPHSRHAHDEAIQIISQPHDQTDLVTRAAAVATLLSLTYRPSLTLASPIYTFKGTAPGRWRAVADDLDDLHERLREVRLDRRDAVACIHRYGHRTNTVIYCDPPYDDTAGYGVSVDYQAVAEALNDVDAAVAVSGYPGCPWTTLLGDWQCLTTSKAVTLHHGHSTPSTECLWINYDPPARPLFELGPPTQKS